MTLAGGRWRGEDLNTFQRQSQEDLLMKNEGEGEIKHYEEILTSFSGEIKLQST